MCVSTVKQGRHRYDYDLLKRFKYKGPAGELLQLHTAGWATAFPWYSTNAPGSVLPWPSVYLGMSAMVGRDLVRCPPQRSSTDMLSNVLALAPDAQVLADARPPALLAFAPLTVMRAFRARLHRPCPLLPPLRLGLLPSHLLLACRFTG